MPKQIKPSQLQIFYALKITVGWIKPVKTMTFFNEVTLPCHLDLLTMKLNLVTWIKFKWSLFPSTAFQVCNTTSVFESTRYFTKIFRDSKGMELTHTILSFLKYLSNMKPHKCARKKIHCFFSLCTSFSGILSSTLSSLRVKRKKYFH